jgi:hypothetical protein
MLSAVRLIVVAACIGSAAHAQTPPMTRSIEAFVNGMRLAGTAELGTSLSGKSPAEQRQIFAQATTAVRANDSFQLVVNAVSSDGARVDVTASSAIRYTSDGCLTVSAQGFVSVVPTSRCVGAKRPSLIVSLLSSDGQTVLTRLRLRPTRHVWEGSAVPVW